MNAAVLTPRPDPGLPRAVIPRSLPRLLAGAPIALVISLALALVMQALIARQDAPAPERADRPELVITSSRVDPELRLRARPEPPADVVAPPPARLSTIERTTPSDVPPIPVNPPQLDPPQPAPTRGSMRVPPQRIFTPVLQYPANMRDREGSCTVAFDVDVSGGTRNVRALTCTNRGFARAAEQAVEKTVYRPAQGDTGPVAVTGLSVELVFRLEE